MKIYTLTLSPAYDVHATAEQITACHENLATVRSRQAGGKGVNISRALHSWGVANRAVVVLGRDNCADFQQELQQTGLDCLFFTQPGRIRENLTIHAQNQPETRISFTGFSVEEGILDRILEAIEVDADTVVTFTGRIPEGMELETAKAFLTRLQQRGAKIVLDSRSFGVQDILEVKPWLIKPNQEEISMFFDCPVDTLEQAKEKACIFSDAGVENTVISMGGQGALLLTGGEVYAVTPPAVDVVSTVGAGDSSIAGFLAAAMEGGDKAKCLRTAVAFGTAACLTEGTQPPEKEAVRKLLEQL